MDVLTSAFSISATETMTNSLPSRFPRLKRTNACHTACFGNLIGKSGRWSFWHIIGEINNIWTDKVQPSIIQILKHNQHRLCPQSLSLGAREPIFALRCYMVGKDQNHAAPHVAMICSDTTFSKAAQKVVLEHSILKDVGWGRAFILLRNHIQQPMKIAESSNLNRMDVFISNGDFTQLRSGSAIVTAEGRKSTLGGFLMIQTQEEGEIVERCMALTVAHVFQEQTNHQQFVEHGIELVDELDLDIYEDVAETSGVKGIKFSI
jgi:hypothetical protein